MDRTVARPDLVYLRRRPHRGETPRTAAAPETASGGLSLRRGDAASPGVATPRSAPTIPTARVRGRTILGVEQPTVTLDRRQSAIGSLAFDSVADGRLNGVWELTDGTAGLVSDRGGITTSPEFGRRSLVELTRGRLVVGLRHVQQLRRLLVVLTELDPQGSRSSTVASLHDGGTVESSHEGPGAALVPLALYQVDGELVVRREGYAFPSLADAAGAYGFTPSWTPPLR